MRLENEVANYAEILLRREHVIGEELAADEELEFVPVNFIPVSSGHSLSFFSSGVRDPHLDRQLSELASVLATSLGGRADGTHPRAATPKNIILSRQVDFVVAASNDDVTTLQQLMEAPENSVQDINYLIDCAQRTSTGLTISDRPELMWQKEVRLSALHVATYNGKLKAVTFILAQPSCKIELANSAQQRALHLAAYKSRLDILQLLVKKGADTLCACKDGYTVLHYAVMSKSRSVVGFCLKTNARKIINKPNNAGMPPLHLLVSLLEDNDSSVEMVRLFISAGADLDLAVTSKQLTALDFAKKFLKPKMAGLLESAKLTPEQKQVKPQKLIAELEEFCRLHTLGNLPFIRQICEALPSANRYNKLVMILREHKASNEGPNFTHWLVQAITKCLFEYNKDNVSPQFLKGDKLLSDVFEALLLYMPQEYLNELHFSLEGNNIVLKPISAMRSFPTLSHMRAACQRSELIKLTCAAANNDRNTVELILASATFDISQTITCINATPKIVYNSPGGQWPGKIQVTAMHVAILNGHIDMVHLLLKGGFNIEAKDGEDKTPLHMAAYRGHIGITELLLQKGAEPNVLNIEQNSPLHLAVLAPITQPDAMHLCGALLQSNADPDIGRSQHPENQRKPSALALKYCKFQLYGFLLDLEQNPQFRSSCLM